MKKFHLWLFVLVLVLSLALTGAVMAATSNQDSGPDKAENKPDDVEIAPDGLYMPEDAGINDVSWWYAFSSSVGTYTEILTGTVHGTPSNDDTSFPAIDLGFTFNYDGVDYTQISIQSNGFIAMGPTISSSYTPLSTGSTNNVVAALARDLEGNDTTSTLMSKMEGTAPNRVFIVQWSHYKRYGSTYTGDDFNFQIKLYETSNLVEAVYGAFAFHDTTTLYVQVGLRGDSNADFNNRTTTTDWTASTAGVTNADTMSLSSTVYPPSGLTYDWALASGLFLVPEAQSGQVCKGGDVVYDLTLANLTGASTAFDLSYASVWPYVGPSTSPVLADEETWDFQVSVHIPWSANPGDSDLLTLTATGGGYSDSATAMTSAGVLAGWTDYADAPRPVSRHSVVYHAGKLYKIGGYDGAAQAYLDIYDIATDTWTAGADMPGARYWINCEAIDLTGTDPKIYCAGGYTTSGQTTLYIYNINTNAWTIGAEMVAYRYDYASVMMNNKYYVIGGYGGTYSGTLFEYDPATNTWNYGLASMAQGRRYASAGVIGGKIYVAGGYKSPSPYYLDSVEIYDPALNTWSAGPTMPTTWLTAADGVKHDRYLILAGGDDNSTAVSSNLVWVLDTVTGTWSRGPDMDHALYSAEADSDGSNFWVVSGRLYDGVYSYSPYTTLLDQCDETCTPVSGADFTWDPLEPWVNYPVTFGATVMAGSPPIYFDWTFGDGGTDEGQIVEHTYLSDGTYTVGLTATNCDGANTSTASHDVDVILPPMISVEPTSLHATQPVSTVTTQTLEICNLGDALLTWELAEAEAGLMDVKPHPAPAAQPAPPPEIMRLADGSVDCAAYENYLGYEPAEVAAACPVSLAEGLEFSPLAPTDIGYALDIGYISDNFVWFYLNNFPGQTVIGLNATPFYGMDFDPTAQVLWALNDTTDQLGTIDLTTGAFTGLVACPPGGGAANWTGLSIDPVTGVFYGSTGTSLFTIDPATGSSTLIGAFGTTLMIDIAVNLDGQMYGHDIGTDSIYSIDMNTGAATPIGLTGYAANYAQGMDFDNDDGTLYIFLYIGSGANVYGTVNLTTGAVTPLSQDNPLGEFEGAIQIPGEAFDIPWVSEDPITGTIPGSSCSLVDVVFDSNVVGVGEYYGVFEIESNDPVMPQFNVPVTLTVGAPPEIEVTMPLLDVTLPQDFVTTLDGTICNLGDLPLNWTISEIPGVLGQSTPFVPVSIEGSSGIPTGITLSSGQTQIVAPSANGNPEDILWDQPLSTINQNAYVNQDFSDYPTYSSFLADDFTNTEAWAIDSIFVPGNGWNGFTTLFNATSLTWQIYADNAGVPDGDPSGGGNPPLWTLTLSLTDPQVLITNGSGGLPSNTQLDLTTPIELPPGTYWLVFYPSMDLTYGQYGRQPADTTNGYEGQFINPGGAFGYGTAWQDWSIIGATQQDIAFRLEGEVVIMDIPWLSEDPVSGTLGSGECIDEYVTFDSTGLDFGVYTGELLITSNDADEPEITLPVTLTVVPTVDFVYYDLEDVVLPGEAVYLAGDFTDWITGSLPMVPNGDNSVFSLSVPLSIDTHEYKYVVYTDTVPTGPVHWDWLQSYPDGSNRSVVVDDSMMVEDYRDIVPGWWVLQWPYETTTKVNMPTENIYGQIWAYNLTPEGGAPRALLAELGYGTDLDPAAWTTWANMPWFSQEGDNDQYASTIIPDATGVFSYAVRFNGNWGVDNPNNMWYYGDTNGDEYNPSDAGVLTVLDYMADLSVTKDGPIMVETGEIITYSLTVENAGPDEAVNVVLVDMLPEGVTFVSATAPCEELEGVVTCELGDMAVDGLMAIEIVVIAPDTAGMLTNDVEVSSDTLDPDETNNVASLETEVAPSVLYTYLPMTFKH